MAVIKVNPDKLNTDAKKIESLIQSYENTYKIMANIIKNNTAGFDKATHTALLQSCTNMEKQFKDMQTFLNNVVTVTKNVAKEYEKANAASGKKAMNLII